MITAKMALWMVDAEDAGMSEEQINNCICCFNSVTDIGINLKYGEGDLLYEIVESFNAKDKIVEESVDESVEKLVIELANLVETIDFTPWLYAMLEEFKAINK